MMEHIGNFIDYIGEHPAVILLVALFHVLVAEFLSEIQMPLFLMQLLQVGAWAVSIIVGIITIISWSHRVYKKYFKK